MDIKQFFEKFPDEETCLTHLVRNYTCKCGETKVYKIGGRRAFSCRNGHHFYPCAGTLFEDSRTPLQLWFYAIYLFSTTRHGVPAKELQRQLGVTYKCAWRIGHQIRKHMTEGTTSLSGHVEIDETYIGGKSDEIGKPGSNSKKTTVMGMVERDGRISTKVIPDTKTDTLIPLIKKNIKKGSTLSTDDHRSYKKLGELGYEHKSLLHSVRQFKEGKHHTGTIEGYWSRLKLSIRGTHIHVSKKHMPKYLGEFEYRYNHRKRDIFSDLINSIREAC